MDDEILLQRRRRKRGKETYGNRKNNVTMTKISPLNSCVCVFISASFQYTEKQLVRAFLNPPQNPNPALS